MRNLRQPFTELLAFPSSNTHSLHNMREYIRNIGSNEATRHRIGANIQICMENHGSIYLALAAGRRMARISAGSKPIDVDASERSGDESSSDTESSDADSNVTVDARGTM